MSNYSTDKAKLHFVIQDEITNCDVPIDMYVTFSNYTDMDYVAEQAKILVSMIDVEPYYHYNEKTREHFDEIASKYGGYWMISKTPDTKH